MNPCEPPDQKTRRSAKNHWPKRKSRAQKEIRFHGVEDRFGQDALASQAAFNNPRFSTASKGHNTSDACDRRHYGVADFGTIS